MNKIKEFIQNNIILPIRSRDSKALQPIILFGAMFLSMGLSFLTSVITARSLGPSSYGNLKYILTVWSLLALTISLGYFYSGSRALVLENDIQKCRELSGTMILISIVMGIIICLVVLLIAFPLDYIFHANVAIIMIQLCPLILVLPLSQALYLILQGANQIYLLAILTGAPPALSMVSIVLLSLLKQISVKSILLSQQIAALIVIIFIIYTLKPSLKRLGFWWSEIKKHHKAYGLPVYRGSLAGVGSTYLTTLSLSYWTSNTAIGFFTLAYSLAEPLKFLPNAISTSSFRGFATKQRITNKVLFTTIIISVISWLAACILFGKPLSWIYSTRFQEVGPMARALGLGAIFLGVGDLFNRFLGAHGLGKSLQYASYANGIASVLFIFIFVPMIGVWGAVLAVIIPNLIYLLILLFSYKSFVNTRASHQIVDEKELIDNQ